MAIELPKMRIQPRNLQVPQREVPINQIIAVEGQNPWATGIQTVGDVIGQTLQKRAALQQQAQQLALASKIVGQPLPPDIADAGIDPETYMKLLAMKQKIAEDNPGPIFPATPNAPATPAAPAGTPPPTAPPVLPVSAAPSAQNLEPSKFRPQPLQMASAGLDPSTPAPSEKPVTSTLQQITSASAPTPAPMIQNQNAQLNIEIDKINKGDFSTLNTLPKAKRDALITMAKEKKTMEGSKLLFNPAEVSAITSGDPDKLSAAFPNGVPKEALSQFTSNIMAGSRADFFSKKGSATFLNELPSNSAPNTAAGAAYAVKVSVRQGKGLIAEAGSPQKLALAASDLARSVMRAAPQLEMIRGADFTNNFITRLNQIVQKFTADPVGTVADVPAVRKEIFDTLDDLDQTATPWVNQKLQNIEDTFPDQLPKNWKNIKDREMGLNIKPIVFNSGPKALKPIPLSTTQGGVTHRWNPQTGKVEPVQ